MKFVLLVKDSQYLSPRRTSVASDEPNDHVNDIVSIKDRFGVPVRSKIGVQDSYNVGILQRFLCALLNKMDSLRYVIVMAHFKPKTA